VSASRNARRIDGFCTRAIGELSIQSLGKADACQKPVEWHSLHEAHYHDCHSTRWWWWWVYPTHGKQAVDVQVLRGWLSLIPRTRPRFAA
jgi:hypothetical protein